MLIYTDIFKPESRRFTWRRKNPIKQARLDYFIISDILIDVVFSSDIRSGYRTDHSLLTLSLCFTDFSRGPGIWKFNTSLLKDRKYLALVKTCIKDEKLKYAAPVYNLENFCDIPDKSLHLTINFIIFLEMLLLRIRGETIKYASHKKKLNAKIEKDLVFKIENLEKDFSNSNEDILDDKKSQLQSIREQAMKGNCIRSRVA